MSCSHISFRALLFTALCLSSSYSFSSEALNFGIHPYKSPQKLLKIYQPLVSVLGKALDRKINIVIAKDYSTHIQQTGVDKLDIAYLGPASYVKMTEKFGHKKLLARQAIHNKASFQGKIIVREDSDIKSISQLKNKSFAFGDPNSTMSHLVPRYMLLQHGIRTSALQKFDFLNSHDNVALSVLTGDYTAGAVKEAVFKKYKKRGIRTLATTPALSEHLYVASNKLPTALVNKIKNTLLDIHLTDEGLKALASIKPGFTRMMTVKDSDYDNLRIILGTLRKHKITQ